MGMVTRRLRNDEDRTVVFRRLPGWRDAEALIEAVVQSQGVAAEVELTDVKTQAEAARLRFLGSPTVRVNGVDIDPAARSSTEYGLKCRVYRAGADAVRLDGGESSKAFGPPAQHYQIPNASGAAVAETKVEARRGNEGI